MRKGTSDDLLTVPEFASKLGVSRGQAYRMVAEGSIPVLRLSPRTTRIPASVLKVVKAGTDAAS